MFLNRKSVNSGVLPPGNVSESAKAGDDYYKAFSTKKNYSLINMRVNSAHFVTVTGVSV